MKAGFSGIASMALSTLLWCGLPALAKPAEITIVTQSFPPLQWENQGRPDGYVADFMLAVIERVNRTVPVRVGAFEFLPWKRAMLMARSVPDVLFFSVSRTAEREDAYVWLGEVSPYGQYLYQLEGRPRIEIDRIEDLKDLDVRIGVQDGSNLLAYLRSLGFEDTGNLVPITDYHQGVEMLYLDRIDLLPLTGFLAEATACRQGYDGHLLKPVIFVEALANPLWAVFSKGTNPALVDAFRKEMAALRKEGFLLSVIRQHQAGWQTLACGARTADK